MKCCVTQGLKVLESPWIFPDFQGLESPWKQTWFSKVLESLFEVLESAWIWFCKIVCLNKIFTALCAGIRALHFQFASGASDLVTNSDDSSLSLILESVKLSNVNWTCLDMVIKVLFLVNEEYSSYGPWKSLKSPWIWFWHLGKNHNYRSKVCYEYNRK